MEVNPHSITNLVLRMQNVETAKALEKNINPFFTQYDRINHVDGDVETLLFMDKFASCRLVADRQEKQLKRQGVNAKVGEGYQVISA